MQMQMGMIYIYGYSIFLGKYMDIVFVGTYNLQEC